MEPALILRAAQIGASFAGNISIKNKLSSIEGKLDILKQQGDQLITREFLGAFDAIEAAVRSKNETTVEIRLKFAEECLLRNSNLDEQITVADHPASFWMMLAHIGLGYVAALREDEDLAARHLLRAFVVEARQARTDYLKEMYQGVFEPELREIERKYKMRLSAIDEELAGTAKKLQLIMMKGVGATLILLPFAAPLAALGLSALLSNLSETQKREFREAQSLPLQTQAETIAKIIGKNKKSAAKRAYEIELDENCSKLAKQLLKNDETASPFHDVPGR